MLRHRLSLRSSLLAVTVAVSALAGCSGRSRAPEQGQMKTHLSERAELSEKEKAMLRDPKVLSVVLLDAAREDDDATIRSLARHGANVDTTMDGRTVLAIAAYRRSGRAVRALLDAGADPDGRGSDLTPLMHAAFSGDAEIAEALVRGGASVEKTTRFGQTSLMFAALFGRREAYDGLVRLGADENAQDMGGNTPKSLRAYANDAKTTESFLRNASEKLVGFLRPAPPP